MVKQKDHEVGAQRRMEGQKEPDGIFSSELKYSTVSVECNEWLVVRANWSPPTTERETKGSYSWFQLWYFMTIFPEGGPEAACDSTLKQKQAHFHTDPPMFQENSWGGEGKAETRSILGRKEQIFTWNGTGTTNRTVAILSFKNQYHTKYRTWTISGVVNIRIWLFSVRP